MKYSPSQYRFVAEVLAWMSLNEIWDAKATQYWVVSKECERQAKAEEDEAAITASMDELHWN